MAIDRHRAHCRCADTPWVVVASTSIGLVVVGNSRNGRRFRSDDPRIGNVGEANGRNRLTNRPIRVLAISPIPEEGAGCRFRIAQFMPFLRDNGFEVTLSPLYTTEFFRLVYKRGHLSKKVLGFMSLSMRRLLSLSNVKDYDVVFIYREIFPIGPAFVERILSGPGFPPIVFDFDDAIFLHSTSDANQLIAALKVPSKVATIVKRSTHVIAGNDYLADYARRFNPAVTMIPTCVDTTVFRPREGGAGARDPRGPVIGWIGSPTTADYIKGLGGVLREVATSIRSCFVSAAPVSRSTCRASTSRTRRGRWLMRSSCSATSTLACIRSLTTNGRAASAGSRRLSSWRAASP